MKTNIKAIIKKIQNHNIVVEYDFNLYGRCDVSRLFSLTEKGFFFGLGEFETETAEVTILSDSIQILDVRGMVHFFNFFKKV